MESYLGPERLMNENYMTLTSPFRIFQTAITGKIETHWHEFYEMTYVVSGRGTHVLNGVPQRLARGSAFLLSPADFHEIVPDANQTLNVYNLIFADKFIRDELLPHIFETASGYTCQFADRECEFIENEYMRIWEESGSWRPDSGFVVQGAVERLLIDVSRKCRQPQPASPAPQLSDTLKPHAGVRKSLLYIQHHFRNVISLEEVASHCGMSTNYFSECFRKTTGVAFQVYVKELRLQFAKSLLSTTQLPITDICFASGFNTLPYFERAFKQKFNLSPRNFRKDALEQHQNG